MHINLLDGLKIPPRFLLQAAVPPTQTGRPLCAYGVNPKAAPVAWRRLITCNTSLFAQETGAVLHAGPSCQGDPTCPRMAGRQTGWKRGGRSCLYCTQATVCWLMHLALGISRLLHTSRWASSWSHFSTRSCPNIRLRWRWPLLPFGRSSERCAESTGVSRFEVKPGSFLSGQEELIDKEEKKNVLQVI